MTQEYPLNAHSINSNSAEKKQVSSQQNMRIDSLLENLNPQQILALKHRGTPLLIVAGAGTGKTTVLTRRVAHLIATGESRPGEILAITFTNKAAAEMRTRIQQLLQDDINHMWISTFHAFGLKILRREAKIIGITSNFSIYDTNDTLRLLAIILKEYDIDTKKISLKSFSYHISKLKNRLIDSDSISNFDHKDPNISTETLKTVYAEYEKRLRSAQAFDFDDLITQTVYLFKAFPEILDKYRKKFQHILVDEYQDTNYSQYILVKHLAGKNLTVVGDSDQSVYAFRGADIQNIIDFSADYSDSQTIILEQNYRSTQKILTAANIVISKNPNRPKKNLWTSKDVGTTICGYVAESDRNEAELIVQEITKIIDNNSVVTPYGDIAIFYRANAQSRIFEEALLKAGLPHTIVGGTGFYQRQEIKDILAYLRVIANPVDIVNLLRIINVPKRGIGGKAIENIEKFAANINISFYEAMNDTANNPYISGRSANAIKNFATLISDLQNISSSTTISLLIEAVIEQSGYLEALQASDDISDISRIENLAQLVDLAQEFMADNPGSDLGNFLEKISLTVDADTSSSGTEKQTIKLMTLHGAKGLEFPVVFLTGMELGVFPHSRAIGNQGELEEERRLAYVGITRAQRILYVTRAKWRSFWGQSQSNPISPFLVDLGADLIEWNEEVSKGDTLKAYRASYSLGTLSNKRGQVKYRDSSENISFAPGDKVEHSIFGQGSIIEVVGAGDKAVAETVFSDGSRKRLLLRYAPLHKL